MAIPSALLTSDAIEEAFERIGIDPSSLTGRHIRSSRTSIRLMLEEWANDDATLWTITQTSQTVTSGDNTYTPPAGTIALRDAYLRRSSADSQMVILSRDEWNRIPNKTDTGRPDRVWLDRALTPTLYCWPVPDNSTDIIIYDAFTHMEDSSTLASSPDVNRNWNEAFVAGLTAKLAEKFKPEMLAEKKALAGGPLMSGGAYAVAKMGERERGDTVISVGRSRRGAYGGYGGWR